MRSYLNFRLSSTTILIVSVFVLSLLLHGCGFFDSDEGVEKLEESVTIVGKIELAVDSSSPVVIALSRVEDRGPKLEAHTVVYGNRDFSFSARAGEYYLLAFEDSNQDFVLQESERVGLYGEPTALTTEPGKKYTDVSIRLREPGYAKNVFPSLFISGRSIESVNIDDVKLGQVVDPSIFQEEDGPLGMWDPVDFHRLGHSGIYFLEPFDSDKTPVLFVHGIAGSGHDWVYLVDQLDRDHFQPWVVQYPSGVSLSLISKSLSESVSQLSETYGFQKMAVVAHSMGGLVSRGLMSDQLLNEGGKIVISPFISISTPWLGHKSASFGAKWAPLSFAVSSWFDLVPGSDYLKSLHAAAMPEYLEHYLLFSYRGKGGGVFKQTNSDGSVSLASQLPLSLQAQAVSVTGYDEDHVGILNSSLVAKNIEKILLKSHPR